MSDRRLEQAALCLLRELGFSAEYIEEAGTPTPDIRAKDVDGVSYLLEIKERTVAWHDQAESERSSLLGVEVMKRLDPGGPSNTIAGVIDTAAVQLESAAAGDSCVFRLVWVVGDPTDREYHYERVRQTVYGIKYVVGLGSPVLQGIYVTYASFVRWRDTLDGVLLGEFEGLLLNDLSPRYENLKGSRIAQLCGDALFDARKIAALGHCYYLPPNDTPPTPESVKERLGALYGFEILRLIDIPRLSAAVLVPDRGNGEP